MAFYIFCTKLYGSFFFSIKQKPSTPRLSVLESFLFYLLLFRELLFIKKIYQYFTIKVIFEPYNKHISIETSESGEVFCITLILSILMFYDL